MRVGLLSCIGSAFSGHEHVHTSKKWKLEFKELSQAVE